MQRGGRGNVEHVAPMARSNAHNARNREATAEPAWKIHWVIPNWQTYHCRARAHVFSSFLLFSLFFSSRSRTPTSLCSCNMYVSRSIGCGNRRAKRQGTWKIAVLFSVERNFAKLRRRKSEWWQYRIDTEC